MDRQINIQIDNIINQLDRLTARIYSYIFIADGDIARQTKTSMIDSQIVKYMLGTFQKATSQGYFRKWQLTMSNLS